VYKLERVLCDAESYVSHHLTSNSQASSTNKCDLLTKIQKLLWNKRGKTGG